MGILKFLDTIIPRALPQQSAFKVTRARMKFICARMKIQSQSKSDSIKIMQ